MLEFRDAVGVWFLGTFPAFANTGERWGNMRLALVFSPQVLAIKRDIGLDIADADALAYFCR
jgi:hypothetical protein